MSEHDHENGVWRDGETWINRIIIKILFRLFRYSLLSREREADFTANTNVKQKECAHRTWKTFGCFVGKMSEQASKKARKFKQNNIATTTTTTNNYFVLVQHIIYPRFYSDRRI